MLSNVKTELYLIDTVTGELQVFIKDKNYKQTMQNS